MPADEAADAQQSSAPDDGAAQDGPRAGTWQGRDRQWHDWQWSSQSGSAAQYVWPGSSWANSWAHASPWWTGSWERSGQDTRDSDLGSSTAKKDVPKTGKDHVPEYSGDSPMREYQRRVRLFEASTGIDPSYRAQKLMERLTGQAWRATESLDLGEIQASRRSQASSSASVARARTSRISAYVYHIG